MSLDYKHANDIIKNKHNNVLWLGDCTSAEDLDWLRNHKVKTVITAALGFNLNYDSSVWHYRYPLQDVKTQNIMKYFDEVSEKIDKGMQKGSVLVHCGAGVSRSATLVIAYLIKHHKMTFHEALKFTRARRPEICPNLGFELQLKKYASPDSTTPQGNRTKRDFHKLNPLKTFMHFPVAGSLKKEHFPQINKDPMKGMMHRRLAYSPNAPKVMVPVGLNQEQKNSSDYLKKMAQFRFGITNASNWGIF